MDYKQYMLPPYSENIAGMLRIVRGNWEYCGDIEDIHWIMGIMQEHWIIHGILRVFMEYWEYSSITWNILGRLGKYSWDMENIHAIFELAGTFKEYWEYLKNIGNVQEALRIFKKYY